MCSRSGRPARTTGRSLQAGAAPRRSTARSPTGRPGACEFDQLAVGDDDPLATGAVCRRRTSLPIGTARVDTAVSRGPPQPDARKVGLHGNSHPGHEARHRRAEAGFRRDRERRRNAQPLAQGHHAGAGRRAHLLRRHPLARDDGQSRAQPGDGDQLRRSLRPQGLPLQGHGARGGQGHAGVRDAARALSDGAAARALPRLRRPARDRGRPADLAGLRFGRDRSRPAPAAYFDSTQPKE
jgi:hypothetical protein